MEATLVNTYKKGREPSTQEPTPTPQLFLLFESRQPLALSSRHSLADRDEVVIGRGKRRSCDRVFEQGARRLHIRVRDPWMSSVHARIIRRATTFILRDANSTNGTMVNGVETKEVALCDGDIIELGQTFFLFRSGLPTRVAEPVDLDASELSAPDGLVSLIPELSQQFSALSQIVKTDTPVVILGQSGTGKELVAKAAHGLSGRPGAFVAVNCGGLPDSLVESEFFGHKKGAFSGATDDRQGLVAAADKGTLFLDEIGDLPMSSQAVLLRVLQEKEVTPVGSTRPIAVDFRLVSATHRDMETQVKNNTFRNDLLGRLSGFKVALPPLEQRREDLGILIGVLVERITGERASEVGFSNDAARALLTYHWPRNVRELYSSLQTALALAGDGLVEQSHLSDNVRENKREFTEHAPPRRPPSANIKPLTPEQAERREKLIELLTEHKGNISAVSRAMGRVRSQVQRWIKRYGLDPEEYRG